MKQKFFEVYNRYYKRSDKLDKMVELADDYAIEFGKWLLQVHYFKVVEEDCTVEQVLEYFKKEKGL